MIYTGVDLIEIERIGTAIERWGDRFLLRVYSAEELVRYRDRLPSLAARWAAKEACAKLLGVGLRGLGAGEQLAAITLTDIETLADSYGRPQLRLHRGAAARAETLGIAHLSVSISHTHAYAVAFVVGMGTGYMA
ncbi:MAG TPA: holo-ACP synthase [Roseiflexaceae bacterium]|nr:holo-ACP synthase [Roseiflexaceae bacterium]HMP41498.1 holo-ACP synthase [Roseiflexaceae bacterium]